MSCTDTRESYALLLAGRLGLTEWARIEAHVAGCDGCRRELDQAFRTIPVEARRRPSPRWGSVPRLYRIGAGLAIAVLLVGLSAYAYRVMRHVGHVVPHSEVLGTRTVAAPVPPPVIEGARVGAATPSAPPVAPDRASALKPAPRADMDVVVQLAAQDRRGAARDLSSLVARVGGARAPRGRDATLRATVPRSRYREFTRGLGRIGSWEVERKSATLPDPVRVAVRFR